MNRMILCMLVGCVSVAVAVEPLLGVAVDEGLNAQEELISLNIPENAPLKVLVAYVSARLDMNVLYDETSLEQRVTLRTPTPIPRSALPSLLDAVLREHGLALADTDAPQLKRIVPLAHVAAGARPRFVQIEHGVASQVQAVVQAQLPGPAKDGGAAVTITSDDRTNSLLVSGASRDVQRVVELIHNLDVPQRLEQHLYIPQAITPRRLDALIRAQSDPAVVQHAYRASIDVTRGSLVVTAPASLHQQIGQLIAAVDQPVEQQQLPVRFYKLTNTIAADVLATLRLLELSPAGSETGASDPADSVVPLYPPSDQSLEDAAPPRDLFNPRAGTAREPMVAQLQPMPLSEGSMFPGESEQQRPLVAADDNTNSIIVIAPPAQQQFYEQIIRQLDQRRPQVLIETTIVALDTSEGFQLGVDIGVQSGRVISFSSFGVSDVDPSTGRLTPIDALGGTFAVLSPDVADVVIRALSTSSRARLVSMPRILVNDNETGKLDSVSREPFERIVTTTGGTTIVGEGETAEAGTRIEITPHISSGDYLQLEYMIELSSFTGQRQPNLPPPSQQNIVESRVTIPDSHTIVVGGLNRTDARDTINAIPLLGQIPYIKHLFRSQDLDTTNMTLFVFIRPVILTDPRFDDLKYLSGLDVDAAELPRDEPKSEPLLMEPKTH